MLALKERCHEIVWRDKVCQKAGYITGRGNGSERRVKSQRHVVNELACCLLVYIAKPIRGKKRTCELRRPV